MQRKPDDVFLILSSYFCTSLTPPVCFSVSLTWLLQSRENWNSAASNMASTREHGVSHPVRGWEQRGRRRREGWRKRPSDLGKKRRKWESNQPDLTLFPPRDRVLPQPTKTSLPQLPPLRCPSIQQGTASFTSEATCCTSNILLEVNEFLTIHNQPVIPITWKRSTAPVQLKTSL